MIAANCRLLGERDWFYERKQDLSHLLYVIGQKGVAFLSMLSVGFTWATAVNATAREKSLKCIT